MGKFVSENVKANAGDFKKGKNFTKTTEISNWRKNSSARGAAEIVGIVRGRMIYDHDG